MFDSDLNKAVMSALTSLFVDVFILVHFTGLNGRAAHLQSKDKAGR